MCIQLPLPATVRTISPCLRNSRKTWLSREGVNPKTVTHLSVLGPPGEADPGVRWASDAGVSPGVRDICWAGEADGDRSERTDWGPVSRRDLFGGIREGVRKEPAGLGSIPTAEPRRALTEKMLSGVVVGRVFIGSASVSGAESGVRKRSLKATGCPWRRRWNVQGGVFVRSPAGGLSAEGGAKSRVGVRDGTNGN